FYYNAAKGPNQEVTPQENPRESVAKERSVCGTRPTVAPALHAPDESQSHLPPPTKPPALHCLSARLPRQTRPAGSSRASVGHAAAAMPARRQPYPDRGP